MILSDMELAEWAATRGIIPYEPGLVNPASVDLRWSGRFRVGSRSGWLDARETESLLVMPGRTYLLDTLETVSLPSSLAGLMTLKSSTGRMGLLLSHAGWVDPGFIGTLSMVLSNGTQWPVALSQGQKLAQIAVMRMSKEPARDYTLTGRYGGQSEPTPAKDAL